METPANLPNRHSLVIDGVDCGWIRSAGGGFAYCDVITDRFQRKDLGPVKFEDITIDCGAVLQEPLYDWIHETLYNKHNPKNGSIITTDYDGKELSRLHFYDALMTEISFPALDARSKDACHIKIKLAPETTHREVNNDGRRIAILNRQQRRWAARNFRLEIGVAGSKVRTIDGLTFKRRLVEESVGDSRKYSKALRPVETPNLVLTLPEADAGGLFGWHEIFVIKGNRDKTTSGKLEYLTEDLKEPIFTLSFRHLGIFRLAPINTEPGSENFRYVKAEMYCQSFDLEYNEKMRS